MSTSANAPYIAEDVHAELNDPDYDGLQHYSRATYARGCKGPLCRLRETHRGRERNKRRALDAGRDYNPADELRKTDREEELMKVALWHIYSRRQPEILQMAIVREIARGA